jgi:uncharacterized membrane protein YfcA
VWMNLTLIASIFAVGNIVFGHFEEKTPKWRRVLKFFLFMGISALISSFLGQPWFYLFLLTFVLIFLIIHGWWLPKNGIHGLTGEPKEKYYALRGWKDE